MVYYKLLVFTAVLCQGNAIFYYKNYLMLFQCILGKIGRFGYIFFLSDLILFCKFMLKKYLQMLFAVNLYSVLPMY